MSAEVTVEDLAEVDPEAEQLDEAVARLEENDVEPPSNVLGWLDDLLAADDTLVHEEDDPPPAEEEPDHSTPLDGPPLQADAPTEVKLASDWTRRSFLSWIRSVGTATD